MTEVKEYHILGYDFSADMSKGAKILRVHVQDGQAKMYVLVQAWSPEERRNFVVLRGTQQGGDDVWRGTYIDSFKPGDGQPMCHLFDITPPEGPLEQLATCGT